MRTDIIKKTKTYGLVYSLFLFILNWGLIIVSQTFDLSKLIANVLFYLGLAGFILSLANVVFTTNSYKSKTCNILMLVAGILGIPILFIGILNILGCIKAKDVLDNTYYKKIKKKSIFEMSQKEAFNTYLGLKGFALIIGIFYIVFYSLPYNLSIKWSNGDVTTGTGSLADALLNVYVNPYAIIAFLISIFGAVAVTVGSLLLIIPFVKKDEIKKLPNFFGFIGGIALIMVAVFYALAFVNLLNNNFQSNIIVKEVPGVATTDRAIYFIVLAAVSGLVGIAATWSAFIGYSSTFIFNEREKKTKPVKE